MFVEAVPKRSRRIWSVALGIVVIFASLLWTLLWAAAVESSSFDYDTTRRAIVSAALASGVFAFVFGVSLVRRRPLNRWGWLVGTGIVLALLAWPVSSWIGDDRRAAPVNRVVQRAYEERKGLANVTVDCRMIEENGDGSESWICDTGPSYNHCYVEISRKRGLIAAHIDSCLDEETL